MEYVVGSFVIFGLILLVYGIQKRIGEEQAREWKEYVKTHPHLFKQTKEYETKN